VKVKLPYKSTGFEPDVVAYLDALREAPLSHIERRLHHPIDIYAIASHEVWDNLNDLLDLVNEISEKQLYLPGNKDTTWKKRLLRQLDHTLDALVQFLDSCRAIIKCCFVGDSSDKFTKSIRRFNDAIYPLADRLCHAINKIKHEQRTLQVIYLHNPGFFIPGYFVEGILEAGVAGPEPALHKGSNSAFSLNRDIPIYVCVIYLASAALAQIIRQPTKIAHAVLSDSMVRSEKIASVLKKVSLLPLEFFPDEIKMPVPLVRFMEGTNLGEATAEIEFPASRYKPQQVHAQYQVATTWTVRSVARTLKMPYWHSAEE
jgi:hypothetical protein